MKKYIMMLILVTLISISGCAQNASSPIKDTTTSVGKPTPNIDEYSEKTEDKEKTLVIKEKISPSYSIYSFEFAYHDELRG